MSRSSRFRPQHRPLSKDEQLLNEALKDKATELEALIMRLPPGRYGALALTALEEAVMWAVKELTS
jgi:hypothetical protein